MLEVFFIYRGDKFVNIAFIYLNTEKWDFIVNIEFLCDVKKSLLYYVDFISAISLVWFGFFVLMGYQPL